MSAPPTPSSLQRPRAQRPRRALRACLPSLLAWLLGCSSPPSCAPSPSSQPRTEQQRPAAPEASQAPTAITWHQWSPEVPELARRRGALIFVSVGYETCHWCHVMHQETFTDPEVIAALEAGFVSVKVDRDVRPDLDALFLDMLRALGVPVGWPANLVLTPDLQPLAGCTYAPPRSDGESIGLLDVLRRAQERARAPGRSVLERLGQSPPAPREDAVEVGLRRLAAMRDTREGGFGQGAKFPYPYPLLAELRSGDEDAVAHVTTTLDAMLRGGVRDLLDGTFHRYTVDRGWRRPHFEKSLATNALVAAVALEAGLQLRRPDYVAASRRVLDTLLARWRLEGGGFAVGFSADDPRGEGRYYQWTRAEVVRALGEERGALFAELHDLNDEPRVLRRISAAAARVRLGLSEPEADAVAEAGYERLRRLRDERPPPERQDELVLGYNALAIEVLANAGRWLEEPRYVRAAQEAMDAAWRRCRRGGRLLRRADGDPSTDSALLEDRALALLALLRLHEADGQLRWLRRALDLGRELRRVHYDEALGTFVDRTEGIDLRRVDARDDEGPGPTSAAALAMRMLADRTADATLRGLAQRAEGSIAPFAAANPVEAGAALVALQYRGLPRREVVIVGPDAAEATGALVAESARWGPAVGVVRLQAPLDGVPALAAKRALGGRPTAFVCEWGRCEAPAQDVSTLRRQVPPALVWPSR